MGCDQSSEGADQETLLFAIRDRLEHGVRPVLRPSEAARLLSWALDCPDPKKQAELLQLFRQLGGLEMVQAALSDFD